MATALLFSIFVLLFIINVPIAISLAVAALIVLATTTDFTMYMIVQRMFAALLSPPLMAIPAFVFAGVLMSHGGIAKYLIAALRSWFGHLPGGLSVVTILACAFFAAISGSSPATAAAIGAIMLPAMLDGGYDKRYAMGLIAAGGTLGILIPPSVTMVVYGVTVEESIGKLFMGGLLPGLLLAAMLIFFAIVYAKIKGYGSAERASWQERWTTTLKALPGAFLPIFILGSIYMGVVTPTEAAVLSVFYTIIVSAFIYRELKVADIRKIFRESINISSMIFLIIAAAMVFALFLTAEQVPNQVAEWIAESNLNKYAFFFATNLMFFIMGTFLEAVSITLITLPLLLPMIKALNIDLIHFAVVMTVNMELAMITPPVGLNLFVVSAMAKERLEEVVRGVLPFILLLILGMVIFIFWPDISLYIPRVLMER
ncbi:TRAP transporter large permease subunit [Desulfofundulus thermobenzoicus]|uniref:TRAP transporter large permease subunit n=1 Tax=Desulfofundulus thermobenzoicus TaxID=29376 RepID=A0A6N7IQR8_9FIRM|nr:TRAP transporter large permease [Desulfofundulus thermobenzoicus]MQL52384.1 TRAP transporter large permease subunit [Desulfofundulus thermobenzoicus]HHW43128.1 TRAP transporter large permease [Desulfotomaculum sp.]